MARSSRRRCAFLVFLVRGVAFGRDEIEAGVDLMGELERISRGALTSRDECRLRVDIEGGISSDAVKRGGEVMAFGLAEPGYSVETSSLSRSAFT